MFGSQTLRLHRCYTVDLPLARRSFRSAEMRASGVPSLMGKHIDESAFASGA